jgi:hypothetical protein
LVRCQLQRERDTHLSSLVTGHDVRRISRECTGREAHRESAADRNRRESPSLNTCYWFKGYFHFLM